MQTSLRGLLALIIGFTFAVALRHYDDRSTVVVAEANAIGTSGLRTVMLAEPERQDVGLRTVECKQRALSARQMQGAKLPLPALGTRCFWSAPPARH